MTGSSSGRCRSCRRPRASSREWTAFEATAACGDDDCTWGGDRCWASWDCGVPAENVAQIVMGARQRRGRRGWPAVPHLASTSGWCFPGVGLRLRTTASYHHETYLPKAAPAVRRGLRRRRTGEPDSRAGWVQIRSVVERPVAPQSHPQLLGLGWSHVAPWLRLNLPCEASQRPGCAAVLVRWAAAGFRQWCR